uniref:Coat protein n=2 Tax=Zootermopsis nevadensis qinvirus 1 TaxID=3133546 RepID=A0AAT9JH71_9VIRU
MTLTIDSILDHLSNGSVSAGIASGADNVTVPEYRLPVCSWEGVTQGQKFVHAFNSIAPPQTFPADFGRIIRTMGAIVASYSLHDTDESVITLVGAAPVNPRYTLALPSSSEIGRAVTVMLAFKVNWWNINHHLGGPKLMSYAAKVIREQAGDQFADVSTGDNLTFLWASAHWLSSRVAMQIFGYNLEVALNGFSVTINSDIAMRIRSSPATTAKVFVSVAVIKLISGTDASRAINTNMDGRIRDLIILAHNIAEHPMSYHPGALYLGVTRIELPDLDDVYSIVKAFLTTTLDGTTLSKAQCMNAITADVSTQERIRLLRDNPTTSAMYGRRSYDIIGGTGRAADAEIQVPHPAHV